MSPRLLLSILLAGLALAAGPAAAQIGLPGGLSGGPPQTLGLPGNLPSRLPVGTDDLRALARDRLRETLRAPARLRGLVRQSNGALEADPEGWPVVRAQVVAIDLSDEGRRRALEAGFAVVREERLEALDLTTVVLIPPRGLSLRRAVERLRRLDPEGSYAFNHVHATVGVIAPAELLPDTLRARAPAAPRQTSVRIGLIDTGIDGRHPAFAGARITQRGFAGPARPGPHGAAVASLMIGRSGGFSGTAPGAELHAADIYGGSAAGGSSMALVEALAWMAENAVPVVNVSLVGPRNALVEAAVRRAVARGMLIVAAAGNDGPSAPPLYPAAYPDVVGATAVNARGRVLPEAGRGPQVDFAAPGADMAAAGTGQGYVAVRGSSFAAPLVAGLLAQQVGGAGRGGAEAAVARTAVDAGARGPDPVYGRGLVAADRRVPPAAVGARGRLTR